MAYTRHRDPLYGIEWTLPQVISRLLETRLCVRYRNITQSASPGNMIAMGALPSRCLHGLGVAYLAKLVLETNGKVLPKEFIEHLIVAAFLHDAGNPPFSHLSEPFLKEITGYDGESYLSVLLANQFFEAGTVFKEFGLSAELLVKIITGNYKPYSDILNGTLDLDNQDNVCRHAFHTAVTIEHPGILAFNLATSFRFDTEWVLPARSRSNVVRWQELRYKVYEQVYTPPHSSLNRMLYRALELMHEKGMIYEDFFLLDDISAIEKLALYKRAGTLVDRARRWQFYEEIFSATNLSNDSLERYSSCRGRMELTEKIRSKFSLEKEDITVFISKSRAVRQVTIPFVTSNGDKLKENATEIPTTFRIVAHVHDSVLSQKQLIVDAIRAELNI